MSRRIACLAVALALGGCHLVDQRDFNPRAGLPPPRPVAQPVAPTPALLTIRYATPDPDYAGALAGLVRRALARKADVLFSVTTLVPRDTPPEDAVLSGHQVAQAIVDAGAAAGQVEQIVQVGGADAVKEVRVNVR